MRALEIVSTLLTALLTAGALYLLVQPPGVSPLVESERLPAAADGREPRAVPLTGPIYKIEATLSEDHTSLRGRMQVRWRTAVPPGPWFMECGEDGGTIGHAVALGASGERLALTLEEAAEGRIRLALPEGGSEAPEELELEFEAHLTADVRGHLLATRWCPRLAGDAETVGLPLWDVVLHTDGPEPVEVLGPGLLRKLSAPRRFHFRVEALEHFTWLLLPRTGARAELLRVAPDAPGEPELELHLRGDHRARGPAIVAWLRRERLWLLDRLGPCPYGRIFLVEILPGCPAPPGCAGPTLALLGRGGASVWSKALARQWLGALVPASRAGLEELHDALAALLADGASDEAFAVPGLVRVLSGGTGRPPFEGLGGAGGGALRELLELSALPIELPGSMRRLRIWPDHPLLLALREARPLTRVTLRGGGRGAPATGMEALVRTVARLLGPQATSRVLARWSVERRYSVSSVEDWAALVEEEAGRALDWLWDQTLRAPEELALDYAVEYASSEPSTSGGGFRNAVRVRCLGEMRSDLEVILVYGDRARIVPWSLAEQGGGRRLFELECTEERELTMALAVPVEPGIAQVGELRVAPALESLRSQPLGGREGALLPLERHPADNARRVQRARGSVLPALRWGAAATLYTHQLTQWMMGIG